MSTSSVHPAALRLQQGQTLENQGRFAAALAAYDEARALLRGTSSADDETRRGLGVIAMNRGNALQKLAAEHQAHQRGPEAVAAARQSITAYDEAIAGFATLPLDARPEHQNHLGAAWLNRGHAALGLDELGDAAHAFQQAIAHLERLPRDADPSYPLHLAGAWTNLAHVHLSRHERRLESPEGTLAPGREAARRALAVLEGLELAHAAFAEMALRARCALAMILGAQLRAAGSAREATVALTTELSDVVDDGLALAREAEKRGAALLRPLALRLFHVGAQLYRKHQPQFLAEFLLENVDPENADAVFARLPEFRTLADEVIADALAQLHRPGLFVAGTPESDKRLAATRSLRDAQQRLAPPGTPDVPSSSPTLPAT